MGSSRWMFSSSRKTRLPEFFEALVYRILEPFPILEEQQRRRLEAFGEKVKWPDSAEPFIGVHFSNELLDAMPMRLISNGTEKLVGLDGDEFVFVERQVDKAVLNQSALDWMDEIAANSAAWLRDCNRLRLHGRGFSEKRSSPRPTSKSPFAVRFNRRGGYYDVCRLEKHCRTCAGKRIARRRIYRSTSFSNGNLSQFGRGGSPEPPAGDWGQSPLPDSRKAKRELQTLLHPEMLGRAFQVLALAKNVDPETNPLAGFKFVAESRSSLRLTDSVQ